MTSQSGLPGGNANEYYHKEQNKGEVLDLLLSGLSPYVDNLDLKQYCKVKHIINTEIDVDNMKGTCKGTGRIQIRLNGDETREYIQRNLAAKGITIRDKVIDAAKKPGFTTPFY